ncbi:hypothetical protein TSAR_006914 [Trichomalopsis sarcophagae]|uniref:ATPase AAA-type core domain-containing protein n=1 Tax=Trichomalopsis sarcophagae TaxID=543379 RepID=A0A232F449_9HYME|nr:hypothetical protein TSAR_006914 [Trichomalopsis sarcophagae]
MLDSRRSKVGGVVSDVNHGVGGDGIPVAVAPKGEESSYVLPWRVFINHIDSYHASKLTDLLLERSYIPAEIENEPRPSVDYSSEQLEDGDADKIDEENDVTDATEYPSVGKDSKTRLRVESLQGKAPRKFELIATALADNEFQHYSKEDVKIIPGPEVNREKFLSEIMECGFVIYDITQDKSQIVEAIWVFNELARIQEPQERSRTKPGMHHFILISSIMTWAATKPRTSKPFTEADFRKRKAPTNFKEHIECERNVAQRRSNLLRGLVLSVGVTYGEEEADLHYAFKLAWSNEQSLPLVGDGENLVPLLHVRDLASAVYAIIRKWPKLRYIVAVDKEPTTQKNLITAISKSLSTGKVKSIPAKEAALSYSDLTPRVLDAITVDLDVRPAYLLKSSSHMEWLEPDSGFSARIKRVVEEYRTARNLRPLRLIILGPPASGKTMIARALARHYRLHYISLKRLIADTIQQLDDKIKDLNKMKEEITEENEDSEEIQKFLDEIRSGLSENNGRLDDDVLTKLKLRSKECQNQGYVIDGYPKTLEQTKLLFGKADDLDADFEDYEKEDIVSASSSGMSQENAEEGSAVMPDLVIVLDASDDFLMERVINLPERGLLNTHYTEEHMSRRLQLYRERNGDENTPLQLFDELEIHLVVLDIEKDESPQMLSTFRYCLSMIGPTRNYVINLKINVINIIRTTLLEKLKEEEEERLCILAEPLRDYLAKYVFPTLTEGLIEVAKLRPDEPIDYLAEYLFKRNPEGRPGEPDYSEEMSTTLGFIQQLQADSVLDSSASSFEAAAYEHSKTADEFSRDCCRCSEDDRSIVRVPGEVACSYNGEDEEEKEASCGSAAYERFVECV